MLVIILIILALFILYESLKGNSATANQAAESPLGEVVFKSVTGEGDNGLSPIDIGGLSLSIPNAVLQWRNLAEKYASIHAILDPEEILAIIWNESTGNEHASNPGDPSWGLMGVSLLIGRTYAGVTTGTDLYIPEKNVQAGSAYLAYLKNKYQDSYDDWPDAYNVGETKFNQGIRSLNNGGYSLAFFSHLNALKGLS